jgi:hypothetical protein
MKIKKFYENLEKSDNEIYEEVKSYFTNSSLSDIDNIEIKFDKFYNRRDSGQELYSKGNGSIEIVVDFFIPGHVYQTFRDPEHFIKTSSHLSKINDTGYTFELRELQTLVNYHLIIKIS